MSAGDSVPLERARRALLRAGLLLSIFASTRALAAPPRTESPSPTVIIFGGGWGAEGTQASIEAHVAALQRVFAGHPNVTTLFASGDSRIRDVQVASDDVSETSQLLGMLFDRREHVDIAYRSSILNGHGPASKKRLLETLDRSQSVVEGTVVFGVGHGSPATERDRASIELFGPDDKLAVDDLAKRLDSERRRGPTAFVLGHCHSGAFTDLLYVAGDAKRRPATPSRCVFAAVPGDRQASGCTADVGDPDARAYVAVFADALDKKEADADGNGRTSLAEADAYARIHDRTVDVPVTSSEIFLETSLGERAAASSALNFDRLLERASAHDKRVLQELRPYPTRDVVKRAVQDLAVLDDQADQLEDDIEPMRDEWDRVRRALLDELLLRYPELANPYHPESRRLLAGEAREVVAFLRPKRELLELDARDSEIAAKENERLEVERRAARLERWLATLERAANEELLRKSAPKRVIESYERLVACEAMEP